MRIINNIASHHHHHQHVEMHLFVSNSNHHHHQSHYKVMDLQSFNELNNRHHSMFRIRIESRTSTMNELITHTITRKKRKIDSKNKRMI